MRWPGTERVARALYAPGAFVAGTGAIRMAHGHWVTGLLLAAAGAAPWVVLNVIWWRQWRRNRRELLACRALLMELHALAQGGSGHDG